MGRNIAGPARGCNGTALISSLRRLRSPAVQASAAHLPSGGRSRPPGSSVWMAKAVMNGRGNEVVDLVRTNLLR